MQSRPHGQTALEEVETSEQPYIVTRTPAGPPRSRTVTRRAFLGTGAAALAGVGAYAGTHARHEFTVTERTFAIRNLPDAFVGYRFVQMSDLHLEEFTE